MNEMKFKKRCLLQDALIFLFGVAALFSALLTVLSLIPEQKGLSVRETITVTASRVSVENATWQLEARGRLRNTSDNTISVERITLKVSGTHDVTLELAEPFTLSPREDYDLRLSATSVYATEGTPEVTAVVDGRSVYLRNPSNTPLLATVFPLALTVLFTVLSVRAVRVRLYLREEHDLLRQNA